MNEELINESVKRAFAVDPKPRESLVRRLASTPSAARPHGRRSLVLLLSLFAVSLAGAAAYLRLRSAYVTFDFPAYGHIELSGVGGDVTIYGPDGKRLGETGSPDPAGGPTVVKIDGATATIEGIGRHQVFDEKGRLRFVIDIQPAAGTAPPTDGSVAKMLRNEELAFRAGPGIAIASLSWLVLGRDPAHLLFWRMEGPGKVTFRSSNQTLVGESVWPAPNSYKAFGLVEDYRPKLEPEFFWEIGSVQFHAKGYGRHVFTTPEGEVIGSVDIEKSEDK
jgi:hypothetical protein